MKVLVVEDNYILAKNTVQYLSIHWMDAEFCRTWEDAIELARSHHFGCIILDLNLPSIDGFTVLERIRKEIHKNIPILILTSQSWTEDIVRWLQSGADDYIIKPVDLKVLLLRIETVMRRSSLDKNNILSIWNISLHIAEKLVSQDGKNIELSRLEFDLLKYLIQNHGKVLSRTDIYENVWGEFRGYELSRVVDMYIGYLRKKIWKDFILTRKGDGYLVP